MLLERMVVRGATCLRRLGGGRRPDEVRFGRFLSNDKVTLKRLLEGWGGPVPLALVEVVEIDPPDDAEPVHWRLLTTHAVEDAAMAWQVVDWYAARWTIEQLWRLLKKQGLRLEDSQIESADRLLKLAAIAARAATVILQLTQARDGTSAEPASLAFQDAEVEALEALDAGFEGRTALQKNPHPKRSLAWAAWIIARLGGWDGYPSSKPPGPITFKHGLDEFRAIAKGWRLRDVCMP